MKTLNEIKDEVAKENGYSDFHELASMGNYHYINAITDKSFFIFAKQLLKDASERATAFLDHNDNPIVATKSILETPILIS